MPRRCASSKIVAFHSAPIHERVARQVESLVDVFQSRGGDGLDADQRSADMGPAHRRQEGAVLGGLHRDLRVEHDVVRQLLQPRHQLETLLRSHGELLRVEHSLEQQDAVGEAGNRARAELAQELRELAASASDLSDRLSRRYFAHIESDAQALAT